MYVIFSRWHALLSFVTVTGMQLQLSQDQLIIQHVEGPAVMNHNDLLYSSLQPKVMLSISTMKCCLCGHLCNLSMSCVLAIFKVFYQSR